MKLLYDGTKLKQTNDKFWKYILTYTRQKIDIILNEIGIAFLKVPAMNPEISQSHAKPSHSYIHIGGSQGSLMWKPRQNSNQTTIY